MKSRHFIITAVVIIFLFFKHITMEPRFTVDKQFKLNKLQIDASGNILSAVWEDLGTAIKKSIINVQPMQGTWGIESRITNQVDDPKTPSVSVSVLLFILCGLIDGWK